MSVLDRWKRLQGFHAADQGIEYPYPIPTVPFHVMRKDPPSQGVGNFRLARNVMTAWFIDPPVGGLNAGDYVFQIARNLPGTYIAALALQADWAFAPGYYRATGNLVLQTVTAGHSFRLVFLPVRGLPNQAFIGENTFARYEVMSINAGTQTRFFDFRFFAPESFVAAVQVGVANVVDAELFAGEISLEALDTIDQTMGVLQPTEAR